MSIKNADTSRLLHAMQQIDVPSVVQQRYIELQFIYCPAITVSRFPMIYQLW